MVFVKTCCGNYEDIIRWHAMHLNLVAPELNKLRTKFIHEFHDGVVFTTALFHVLAIICGCFRLFLFFCIRPNFSEQWRKRKVYKASQQQQRHRIITLGIYEYIHDITFAIALHSIEKSIIGLILLSVDVDACEYCAYSRATSSSVCPPCSVCAHVAAVWRAACCANNTGNDDGANLQPVNAAWQYFVIALFRTLKKRSFIAAILNE